MAPKEDKSPLSPSGQIAHIPHEGFRYTVFNEGRSVRCQTPVRAGHPNRASNQICNAEMKNGQPSISNHWTKQHKPNSAKSRDMEKDPSRPWKCPCGLNSDSWDNHLAHIRTAHGFKGSAMDVKDAGGLLNSGIQLDPVTRRVIMGEGFGGVNNHNEDPSVPPQQDGPHNSRSDNNNPSYTHGPPQSSHGDWPPLPVDPAISHGTRPHAVTVNASYGPYGQHQAHLTGLQIGNDFYPDPECHLGQLDTWLDEPLPQRPRNRIFNPATGQWHPPST
ncbi:hypothetical protein PG999_004014 [Apiospora kogelbergensis]|uniref:Uncharacterized protein n=1 Tax=Apiospora kogelbergensis TaxID=1337665 RepID=A0AAW0R5A4_9PEZI